MKKGDRVRCVDGDPESCTMLTTGQHYTVKRTFRGPPTGTEAPIGGMEKTPGCTVVGLRGYFRQDRFEVEP